MALIKLMGHLFIAQNCNIWRGSRTGEYWCV